MTVQEKRVVTRVRGKAPKRGTAVPLKKVKNETHILESELPHYIRNPLWYAGIDTFAELNALMPSELKNLRGIGKKGSERLGWFMVKAGFWKSTS